MLDEFYEKKFGLGQLMQKKLSTLIFKHKASEIADNYLKSVFTTVCMWISILYSFIHYYKHTLFTIVPMIGSYNVAYWLNVA